MSVQPKTPCHYCQDVNANHYVGGGMWVCFKAWLALCCIGKGCRSELAKETP